MLNTTTNPVKKLLKSGKPTAGAWLQTCSPMAADILASCGFDWLMVDLEHSPCGFEKLAQLVQAMQGRKAVPFVRAPWNDFVAVKRILDTGVYGVLVPYVSTKAEAENAVKAAKYPPLGIRGLAGSTRAAGYGAPSDYLKKANDETVLMIAIETPEGVANLDEIISVDHLDGIFIGPMDLATSMGHFCDPKHPEVQAAIAEIERKVFASGKFLGTVCGSWEQAEALYDKGYQYVVLMADGTSMGAVGREKMKQFKEKFPELGE